MDFRSEKGISGIDIVASVIIVTIFIAIIANIIANINLNSKFQFCENPLKLACRLP